MAIPKMEKNTLIRFLNGQSTEEERIFVSNWLLDPANEELINEWLEKDWLQLSQENTSNVDQSYLWLKIQEQVQVNERKEKRPVLFSILRYSAAAAIIGFVISLALFFQKNDTEDNKADIVQKTKNTRVDIMPPTEARAVLTLADGSKIYLDSSVTGKQIQKGPISIDVSQNGDVKYSNSDNNEVVYNTLSIPKGSKPLSLTLSDGTKVWLNAASSITYPTRFIGKERKVDMTGELYYEVAKNESMPFVVKIGEVDVKVLGTHFNINAYDNHLTKKITLLEGAVQVTKNAQIVKLAPGQQAETGSNKVTVNDHLDLEQVMAWKNGQFNYTGSDLKTIMKDIERFYDIEVEYKDDIPYQFVAKISRDVPVSSFLEKLEMTNLVHFKIVGKKIIVTR